VLAGEYVVNVLDIGPGAASFGGVGILGDYVFKVFARGGQQADLLRLVVAA
jgi:hypothetical protein